MSVGGWACIIGEGIVACRVSSSGVDCPDTGSDGSGYV